MLSFSIRYFNWNGRENRMIWGKYKVIYIYVFIYMIARKNERQV